MPRILRARWLPSSFASVSIRLMMLAASILASFSIPRISSRFASSAVRPATCSRRCRCASMSAFSSSSRETSCFSRASMPRSRFSTSAMRDSTCCVFLSRFSSFCCRRRSLFFSSSLRCCTLRSKSDRICRSFSFASRSASLMRASACLLASATIRSELRRASSSCASPLLRYTTPHMRAAAMAPAMTPATIAMITAVNSNLRSGGLRGRKLNLGEPRLSRVRDSYLNLQSRWAPYPCRLGYLHHSGRSGRRARGPGTRAPEVRKHRFKR